MALVQSLPELMRECVRRLQLRFPAMLAGVMVHEGGMSFRTIASADETWENRTTVFDERSFTGRVMAEGGPQYSTDMWADPRYDSETARQARARGGLVVPVPGRQEPWGTIGDLGHRAARVAAGRGRLRRVTRRDARCGRTPLRAGERAAAPGAARLA